MSFQHRQKRKNRRAKRIPPRIVKRIRHVHLPGSAGAADYGEHNLARLSFKALGASVVRNGRAVSSTSAASSRPVERNADGMELLKEAIRPPKLEDAGLEDCALPPEAIKEAFLKAADFVKSRVVADEDEEEGGYVGDGGPSNGEMPDVLVGTGEVPEEETLCGGVRKTLAFPTGKEQGLVDDVVVVGSGNGGASDDDVVVWGGGEEDGGGKACFGEGVWDGEKKKSRGEEGGGNEEGELTLAAVLI